MDRLLSRAVPVLLFVIHSPTLVIVLHDQLAGNSRPMLDLLSGSAAEIWSRSSHEI